jgi:uncharacterized protein YjbI with pentapeptide repeats
MDQITIRQTSAELPRFDEKAGLEPVSQLGAETSLVADFQFADATLAALDLAGAHLLHGKIRALNAGQATISAARMDSVEFTGCSLREAELTGCDLAGSLFDGCDLRLTGFGPGHYRRCDLRGNDLSALTGVSHLKHVIIDHVQAMQLGEALAAELEVTFGEDLPDCL